MIVKIAKALKVDRKELTVAPVMEKIDELTGPDTEKESLCSDFETLTGYY